MKKLFLIFHGRFPSEKAASLFAAKSAEVFGINGLKTTLIVPRRKGALPQDPFSYYDVSHSFDIVYIPTLSVFTMPFLDKIAFVLSYIVFSIRTTIYVRTKSGKEDIIYSNEILPLTIISYINPNCFYEMHDFPESKLRTFGWCLRKMKWILVHNKWKLAETKKLFPQIPEEKFLYEPNAVEMKAFALPLSREEARKKLSLPLEKKIAVYTGHLYAWKGVDTLAAAASLLPNDFIVIFVGGTYEDVAKFRTAHSGNPQISIIGHINHSEVPVWQKAADVLVLPNTAKEKISAFYTSPMKLFEYMASGVPIVATRIPSILEIVHEESAILVEADDPMTLANGLKQAVSSDTNKAERAFLDVQDHTWQKRAERIINFINK